MIQRRTIIVAVGVLVCLAAGAWWLKPSLHEAGPPQPTAAHEAGVLRYPPGAPQLAQIRTGHADLAPLPLAEALSARLAYDESVTARVSSPVLGRVVAIPGDVGDKVKADQPVVVIDSPDLGTAVADADKAVADSRRKELAWQRAKKLFEGEVLAKKDLEGAEADWQQARAEEQRARLKLDNLRVRHGSGQRGESFTLVSPIAGIITERSANPGMEVRPDLQAPLFVVSDPSQLWAMIDLPENLLDKVRPGQRVMLETQAFPGTRFQGQIAKVAPALDPATRRIPVRVTVPNPDGRLRPEMFARVALLAGDDKSSPVLRLPATAVVTEGVGHVVFVERAPGEFVKRRVDIALQDHDYIYLSGGLKANEVVVQAGALLLASELAGGD
jgi:cobalt-zinc-cadmium efflux system membrane fusion protein